MPLVVLAAWNPIVVNVLIVVFLLVSVVMLLTILMQKPQGGGLSAAFGAGASSGQTAFGAKTGDALTIFTVIIFFLYVTFASLLNIGSQASAVNAGPDAATSTDVDPEGVTPEGAGAGTVPTETTPAPAEQNPAATPSEPAPAPAPVTPAPDSPAPQQTPATTPPGR